MTPVYADQLANPDFLLWNWPHVPQKPQGWEGCEWLLARALGICPAQKGQEQPLSCSPHLQVPEALPGKKFE